MVDVAALAVFALQSAILGLFLVALRRGDAAAASNALAAFTVALLPVLTQVVLQEVFARSVTFGSILPLWIGVAGLLHSVGMLGLYESTWWWDHLTHVVSAALVAALVYAGFIVARPGMAGGTGSPGLHGPVTVLFTFAVGVFWELFELVAREVGERFDVEPVLVHYGWRDTGLDLGFDVVGALLVIGADVRLFVPTVAQFPGVTEALLVGSWWLVLVGSVLMAVLVGVGTRTRA